MSLPRIVSTVLICFAALSATACRGTKPAATLQLRSIDSDRQMTQTFSSAVYQRGGRGEYDIILVDQNEGLSSTANAPGKPLETSSAAPLTHLLHVRVLYRPKRAMRPGAANASNAAVHWVVLSRDGRIDYTGAGLAQISGDDSISVRLRGIRMSPTATAGELDDPVGPATLDATFRARLDPATVRSALAIIYDNADQSQNPDYRGPPARNAGP